MFTHESRVLKKGKTYLVFSMIFLALILFSGIASAGLGLVDETKPKLENLRTDYLTIEDLQTKYYSPTESSVISGTVVGTLNDVNHTDGNYDDVTLNITEQVAAPALDIRVNFTSIPNFNGGIARYYTGAITGSAPVIQLYDYDSGTWESYGTLGQTSTFSFIDQRVYDSNDHLQNGVVQMRIYKSSTGNINNKYYVDWLALTDGIGVPSGNEIDPIYTVDKSNIAYLNASNSFTGHNTFTSTYNTINGDLRFLSTFLINSSGLYQSFFGNNFGIASIGSSYQAQIGDKTNTLETEIYGNRIIFMNNVSGNGKNITGLYDVCLTGGVCLRDTIFSNPFDQNLSTPNVVQFAGIQINTEINYPYGNTAYIIMAYGSSIAEQTPSSGGVNRLLMQANGDRLDLLNRAGNKYLMSIRNDSIIYYDMGVQSANITISGLEINGNYTSNGQKGLTTTQYINSTCTLTFTGGLLTGRSVGC